MPRYIKPEEYDEYLKDFATISYESYVVTMLRMGFTRDKLIEMIDKGDISGKMGKM